jgi:hypothetical protein
MTQTRIIVNQYGGPDKLRVVEDECPEPREGEVRVKVLAAGVSLPDVLPREGVHPETPRVPYTPGWDLVGMVDQLGEGVTGFEPGQRVAAMPIHGSYAQVSELRRTRSKSYSSRFRKSTARRREKYGGTGLRLATSPRFCQLMGGGVTVASEPGKGSTSQSDCRCGRGLQMLKTYRHCC